MVTQNVEGCHTLKKQDILTFVKINSIIKIGKTFNVHLEILFYIGEFKINSVGYFLLFINGIIKSLLEKKLLLNQFNVDNSLQLKFFLLHLITLSQQHVSVSAEVFRRIRS